MLMLAPAGNGVARFMLVAESDELNPPPFGCEGGCSSVVPITGAAEPSVRETRSSMTCEAADPRFRLVQEMFRSRRRGTAVVLLPRRCCWSRYV